MGRLFFGNSIIMHFSDLDIYGWLCVDGVSSHAELLDLGRTIGCPVPSPNGEMIKEIGITPAEKAQPGTQAQFTGLALSPCTQTRFSGLFPCDM